jgi:DNA-binding XRE family transcriptional regulator
MGLYKSMQARKILMKNVEQFMAMHNLSITEMALKCDTARQNIFNIKKGLVSPPLETIDKLCNVMGCKPSDLFTENYFSDFEVKIVKKKAK